jgi:hypothetical protein
MSGNRQHEQERHHGTERVDAATPKHPEDMTSFEHFLCDYAVVPEVGDRDEALVPPRA